MGVHGLLMLPIDRFHLLAVSMVSHAVEEGDDAIWTQIQGCDFLPESVCFNWVSLHKLGLGQLAGEQKGQLSLFQGRKVEGVFAAPLGVPSRGECVVHRSCSWGSRCNLQCAAPGLASGHARGFSSPFAIKRIACYSLAPMAAPPLAAPTPPGDLPW